MEKNQKKLCSVSKTECLPWWAFCFLKSPKGEDTPCKQPFVLTQEKVSIGFYNGANGVDGDDDDIDGFHVIMFSVKKNQKELV